MYALSYWVASAILSGVGKRESYESSDVDEAWPVLLRVIEKLDADTMIARLLTSGSYPDLS